MSSFFKPSSIIDEIIQTLRYSQHSEVDEFTLRRYLQNISKIKKERVLTDDEYIALGLILFNMKKYSAFLAMYDEAKRIYSGNTELHAHDTLGRFQLTVNNLYSIPDFDLYDYWFNELYNPRKIDFDLFHSGKSILFFDKIYKFIKEMVIKVNLSYNKEVVISTGPFIIKTTYDEAKLNNFRFEDTVIFEYVEKIRKETVQPVELSYMKDLFGDTKNKELLCLVNRDINQETKDVFENTDNDIAVKIIDAEHDLMELLDCEA